MYAMWTRVISELRGSQDEMQNVTKESVLPLYETDLLKEVGGGEDADLSNFGNEWGL